MCKMDLRQKTPVALSFYSPVILNLLPWDSKRASAAFLSWVGLGWGWGELPLAAELGRMESEYFQHGAGQEGGPCLHNHVDADCPLQGAPCPPAPFSAACLETVSRQQWG